MKERCTAILLAVAMVLSLLAFPASAETTSGTCGDNLIWTLDSGVLTISGTGEMISYYWDEDIPWYSQRATIASVVIENGVTSITYKAFYKCPRLSSISIPDSVTSIGTYAFYDCSSLTSISIPDSVTSIGTYAFYDCSSLTSVTIPGGVTGISDYAFYDCSRLTSITIPDSVTIIGYNAIGFCDNLADVYYGGSKEAWSKITIHTGNIRLSNAVIHFNSADPEAPATDPFPSGTAEFYYTASGSGDVKKYSFWYDSDFFNQSDILQPKLAVASLCLEMAAFTNGDNLSWDSTLSSGDTRRAYNIQQLYETLGFTNAQYVNYDTSLTDTSDKVAFSMAMKYIDDGEGGTDTLVAIPIRGGGYGGEWASNFNVAVDWEYAGYYNHLGFWAAAGNAQDSIEAYLDGLEIKGDVKIWLVGFSRGAAVANILAHLLAENATPGGIQIQRKNLYAYTFATPAGVSENMWSGSDSNIYNFISPVDVVPMVTPSQWGYQRYGVTVTLPDTMSDDVCKEFKQLSGEAGDVKIGASQRILLNDLLDWTCDLVPDAANYCSSGIQELATKAAGTKLGANPDTAEVADDSTGLVEGLSLFMTAVKAVKHPVTTLAKQGVKYSLEKELNKAIDHIKYAHYPELYLCQLEAAAARNADLTEEAESKQLLLTKSNINVRFWEDTDDGKNLAATILNGVCTSGEIVLEETTVGIVATFPAGKNYTFQVSGAGADTFGYIAYIYDNDTVGAVRTVEFENLPLDSGETYTGVIPADTNGAYTIVDSDGGTWTPDYDSETDGARAPEYAEAISFDDVQDPSSWYYTPVYWAVENGITSGTGNNQFSPTKECTRAQIVTFLWNSAGQPEPTTATSKFTDVDSSAWYYKAVQWAVENNITAGTAATTFSPDMKCSRAQIVTFLWNYAGKPSATQEVSFSDVSGSAWYYTAVQWAVGNKITAGTGNNQFSPNTICSRAQAVTFLYNDLNGKI